MRRRGARALRIAVGLATLAAVAGAAGAPAARAEGEVEAAMVVGWGAPVFHPGWVPVRVTLRNVSPDDLRVRAVVLAAAGPASPRAVRFERAEALARGAEKRFTIYAFLEPMLYDVSLRVERDGGSGWEGGTGAGRGFSSPAGGGGSLLGRGAGLRARVAMTEGSPSFGGRPQRATHFAIGVVSRRMRLALAFLAASPSGKIFSGAIIQPLAIEPEELPDRRVGYGPLDALVLHDVDPGALSPEQQRALREWTLGGGSLVLARGADPGWLSQPFFHDLLPPGKPRFERCRVKIAAALEETEAATLVLDGASGGSAIMGDTRGVPLAVRYTAGLGTVTLLTVDPASLEAGARQPFWESLLAKGFEPRGSRRESRWPVVAPPSPDEAAYALLVSPDGPPFAGIALLGLAYIVAVGPLSFAILRRRGREILLVWTIPGVRGALDGRHVRPDLRLEGLDRARPRGCVYRGARGRAVRARDALARLLPGAGNAA